MFKPLRFRNPRSTRITWARTDVALRTMFSFPPDDATTFMSACPSIVAMMPSRSKRLSSITTTRILLIEQFQGMFLCVKGTAPILIQKGRFWFTSAVPRGEGLTTFSIFRCIPFDANHRYVACVRFRAQPSHQKRELMMGTGIMN
jgi:hypothetical protein